MYNRARMANPYVAKVDIKELKDSEVLADILSSTIKSTVSVDLSKLKDNPKAFEAVVVKNIGSWISSGALPKFLKLYDKNNRSGAIDEIIRDGVCSFMQDIKPRKGRYKLGKDIPSTIKDCIEFFDSDTKSKVLKSIIEKQDSFYSYARKLLAQTAVELADSDSELIEVLNTFYKVMEKDAFFNITNRIQGGVQNPGVQRVLNKTKKFNVCTYTKAEVKADKSKRIELLKDIARAPSSAKNLNFIINFTTEDLEALAPIMRFNLLQWYYRDRFRCASRNYNRPDRYKKNIARMTKNTGLDKINLPPLSETALKNMLFSVGLKKNNEVVGFVEKYNAFKKIESGLAMTRDDAHKVFGRGMYFYY